MCNYFIGRHAIRDSKIVQTHKLVIASRGTKAYHNLIYGYRCTIYHYNSRLTCMSEKHPRRFC